MPKFTFTSPEGKTYDIEGPEGATKEQAFGILQQKLGSAPSQPKAPATPNAPSFGEKALGAGEAGLSMLSGIPAALAGAIYGVGKGVTGGKYGTPQGVREGEAAGADLAEKLTYQPRTKTGQEYLQKAGETFEESKLAGMPVEGPGIQRVPKLPALGREVEGLRGIPKPPSEAVRASKASGIPLTIGQETGSKGLQFTENRLRELFPSKGTAAADEMKQVTAGANRVNQLADQLSANQLNQEGIGNQLRSAYTNTVKKIDTLRDTQAKTDYDAVRKLAGDKPVIKYQNTLDTLDKIIAENKDVPSGDGKKVYAQAVGMRKMLAETAPTETAPSILGPNGQPARMAAPPVSGPQTATIDAAMKTRSAWGKAARRSGNVFSDIDQNANQVLAKRLFGAINKDFDEASTVGTPIGKALKEANTNYSKASQSIDYIKKSALGKLLGEDVTDAAFTGETFSTKAPEAIAKRYLTMTPSQSAQVTSILREHSPEVLQDAKAFVLRNGLDAAKNEVPGQPAMAFGKFRREMERVEPKMKEMGFTPKEIKDIKDVTDTMARAGDKTGANPSGTSGAIHMGGAASLAFSHPMAAITAVLTPYAMSKALLTQQGRDLLRQAATAPSAAARTLAVNALKATYATAEVAAPAAQAGATAARAMPATSDQIPTPP